MVFTVCTLPPAILAVGHKLDRTCGNIAKINVSPCELSEQATPMYRGFITGTRKLQLGLSRSNSSYVSEAINSEKRKLQTQHEHELTNKRLELGLKQAEVSRSSSPLLTLGVICLIVSGGAWSVSRTLTELKAHITYLERELDNQGKILRTYIAARGYQQQCSTQRSDSQK